MYITVSSSASSILRASSRVRFASSFSRFSSRAPPSLSPSTANRSLSSSSSSLLRSFRASSSTWSQSFDYRSPISVRAQIGAVAPRPAIHQFERKIASIAAENAFKGIHTSLPKPGGGEYGKYYSLKALNDPRVGKSLYRISLI